MSARFHVGDTERSTVLSIQGVLATPAEPGFHDIVHLARRLRSAPVAFASHIAGDRPRFKARLGLPCQTDLNASACAHALAEPDRLLVNPGLAVETA